MALTTLSPSDKLRVLKLGLISCRFMLLRHSLPRGTGEPGFLAGCPVWQGPGRARKQLSAGGKGSDPVNQLLPLFLSSSCAGMQ